MSKKYRNLRKCMSVILACMMILSLTPMASFAGDEGSPITVTFDAQGGVIGVYYSDYDVKTTASAIVNPETGKVEMPTPRRAGYVFEGWFAEDGTTIDTFTEDTTLYAHYSQTVGEDNVAAMYVRADKENASPGDIVTYTVSMKVDEGIGCLGFIGRWTCDEGLTIIKGSLKTVNADLVRAIEIPTFNVDTGMIIYDAEEVGYPLRLNEETDIITFQCRVNEMASGSCKVSLEERNCTDSSLENYTFTCDPAIVNTPVVNSALTVINGTGSGSYETRDMISITANPAPAGKEFKEWQTSNGGKFTNYNDAATTFRMPANATTVTAIYDNIAANKHHLTVNGGTGTGEYAEGRLVTLTADPAPSRMHFDIWQKSAGGTLADKTAETTLFTMPANATTVTAIYRYDEFTVTLDVNDGTSATTSAVIYSESSTISSPTREGFEFTGWYAEPTGGKSLTVKEILENAITPVYAHWYDISEKSKYKLEIVDGVGSGTYYEGFPVNISTSESSDIKFFKEWQSSDGGSFANANDAATVFTMPANATTVTAVYEYIPHTITFNANGGTVATPSAVVNPETGKVDFPIPTREGYNFNGWYTEAVRGKYVSSNRHYDSDAAFYAHWSTDEEEQQAVMSVEADKTQVVPGDEITFTVSMQVPENVDWKFFSGSCHIPSGLTFVEDSVVWTDNTEQTNGKWDSGYREIDEAFLYKSIYYDEDLNFNTKTEIMSFKCTVDENATGKLKIYISNRSATNHKRSMEYSYVSDIISLPEVESPLTVVNGTGSGNYTPEETVEITANPAPAGKEFKEWTTSDGGTFANANNASTTFTMPANATTVAAIYQNQTITVTFNANGGTVATPSAVVNPETGKVQLPTPAREGCEFEGWYTAVNGGDLVTSETVISADTIIYAHWIKLNTLKINSLSASSGGKVNVNYTISLKNENVTGTSKVYLAIYDDNGKQLGIKDVSSAYGIDSQNSSITVNQSASGKYTAKLFCLDASGNPISKMIKDDYQA